jgi:hypothetical protein
MSKESGFNHLRCVLWCCRNVEKAVILVAAKISSYIHELSFSALPKFDFKKKDCLKDIVQPGIYIMILKKEFCLRNRRKEIGVFYLK